MIEIFMKGLHVVQAFIRLIGPLVWWSWMAFVVMVWNGIILGSD